MHLQREAGGATTARTRESPRVECAGGGTMWSSRKRGRRDVYEVERRAPDSRGERVPMMATNLMALVPSVRQAQSNEG